MSEHPRLDAAQLFRLYSSFVTRFVLRLGIPRADLDDLVQEVFLVAHRAGGYSPGPAKPSTYLASIAVRLLHTERRKKRLRSFIETTDEHVEKPADTADPERQVEDRQELERLASALGRMNTAKRAVLVRSDIDGESVVSIAAGLGINTDTAYTRLRSARLEFRRLVDEAQRGAPGRHTQRPRRPPG